MAGASLNVFCCGDGDCGSGCGSDVVVMMLLVVVFVVVVVMMMVLKLCS